MTPFLTVFPAGHMESTEGNTIATADGRLIASLERADRVEFIAEGLARSPLVRFAAASQPDHDKRLHDLLHWLHAPDYLSALQSGEDPRVPQSTIGPVATRLSAAGVLPDTPLDPRAFRRALGSAFAAFNAAECIIDGRSSHAYALGRPPGHHAGHAFLGGYCFLNNAAVAALVLHQAGFGPVHVLDIDYHVGNGTSDVLSQHPRIGFTSLHAATDHAFPYIPSLSPAHAMHHYAPFHSPPTEAVFLDELEMALQRVAGTAVLVLSIGFDIIKGDPHGGWNLPPAIFNSIGQRLADLRLPLCFVQEGGYLTTALAECAESLMTGLSGVPSISRKLVS